MQSPDVIDDHCRLLRQGVLDWSCFTYALAQGGEGCFGKVRGVVADRKTIGVETDRESDLVIELQNRNVAPVLSLAADKGVTTGELKIPRSQSKTVGYTDFFQNGWQRNDRGRLQAWVP
ncbi:hypothetical protein D3C85_1373770 [compost metagenome]